ncbi:hypothetical protein GBA52_024259 [Prunus armeniaca]|nr:hypothetical protein GBA52_024259 [Prunus armeniaca]
MKHALAHQGSAVILATEERDVLVELARGFIKAMEDTTKKTWEKLKWVFAARLLSNKFFLKVELLNLWMKKGRNLKFRKKEGCFKIVFDTYEEMNGSKIMLGDKTSYDVLGVGIVKIKMQNGVVRSFYEVRHVPTLRRNLISLGALYREEYSYKEEEEKLLVTQRFDGLLKTSWVRKVSQGCMIKSLSSRVFHFKGVEVVVSEDKIHKVEVKTKDEGENVVGLVATKKDLSFYYYDNNPNIMVENNNLPISDGKISKKQHHMFGFKATVCILGLVKIQGSKKAMRKKFCIGDLSSAEEVRMAQV